MVHCDGTIKTKVFQSLTINNKARNDERRKACSHVEAPFHERKIPLIGWKCFSFCCLPMPLIKLTYLVHMQPFCFFIENHSGTERFTASDVSELFAR